MHHHRYAGLVVGAALGLLCAVVPLAGGAALAQDAKPFKIGVMLSLSGPGAGGTAVGAQQGFELAVEQINAQKLAGRPFEISIVDDGSDPRTAGDACNRLVLEGNIDAIVSVGPTATRMACNQPALEAGIPHIAALSGPGGMCIPNLFMAGPETSQTLFTLINHLTGEGAKKLYYIGTDNSAIRQTFLDAEVAAKSAGGEFVGSSFATFGTTDFSSDLAKIAASGADAVVMMLVGADPVTFSRQFGNDERMANVLRADFLMNEKVLTTLGASARNLFSAANYYRTVPGAQSEKFIADLKAKFGDQALPDTWAAMAYDAMLLLAKTVTTPEAGRKEVLDGLATGPFVDGPQGKITVTGKYVTTPVFVAKTDDEGKLEVVASFADVPPAPHCK